MKNQPEEKKKESEEKVGVIPVSEIKGSDADAAYPDESTDTKKQAKQAKGTDADSDT